MPGGGGGGGGRITRFYIQGVREGRDKRNKGKSREDLCRNIIRARVEAFFVKNDF